MRRKALGLFPFQRKERNPLGMLIDSKSGLEAQFRFSRPLRQSDTEKMAVMLDLSSFVIVLSILLMQGQSVLPNPVGDHQIVRLLTDFSIDFYRSTIF